MESLAYLELALVCEAPTEPKICQGLKWKHLSSNSYIHLLSLALMLSVLSAASSASAQIDPVYPNLRSVQDQLRDLGYFNRTSTGQLGPMTQQALTNFQRDYQLSLTGRPDRDTVIALNSLADIDNRPFRTINANYPNYGHYRELRFGDRGADVANLQRKLKHLGYFNTHPTGSFREITFHAVKYFQRINGLRVTGVADRQTLALLFGKRTPIPPVTIPDDISGNGGCKGLRFGDRGATVDLIQRQLKVLGYFEGKVDGKFRERTLYAVTRFQQDYNLVSDGCADTATLTAIDARLRAFAPNYPDAYWPDNQSSRPNYTNKQIVALQWQLQELDYYNGSIDGVFDEEVRDALIQFQEDHSLPATGRVDRNTQVTLNRLLAKERSSREITLRRGDRGPDVRQLQSWLKNAGKNPGPINGVFGAETEFAVLSFQQESNLSPATGIATPATLAALQNGLTRRPTISAMPISSNSNSRSSILQLQRRLQDLGFYNGSLNGVFDTPTRAALAQAQNSYGVNSDDLFSQTF